MKVKNIGSNQTEIETEKYLLLVSYQTPVAYEEKKSGRCFRSSTKFSNTTSKHVNAWLEDREATLVEQEVLDSLLEEK